MTFFDGVIGLVVFKVIPITVFPLYGVLLLYKFYKDFGMLRIGGRGFLFWVKPKDATLGNKMLLLFMGIFMLIIAPFLFYYLL